MTRRHGIRLALACVLAVVCLVIWLDRERPTDDVLTPEQSPAAQVPEVHLQGAADETGHRAAPGPTEEPPSASPQRDTIRVRVLEADDGTPVQGAHVRLLTPAVGGRGRLGIHPYSSTLLSKVTDAGGEVVARTPPSAPLIVEVTHPAYMSTALHMPPTRATLEVRLAPGSQMRGRVVDPSGAPVSDVRVTVHSTRLPASVAASGNYPEDAEDMVTVTTDAFGEWAMRGVESASYQYLLDDPAWTMVDSKDVGPGSPADGAQILITAAPVRVFRLRFVHASTETTVVPQSVRVTPPPGVFGKHVLRAETDSSRWLSDGKQGRRLPAVSAARGVYEGYVVFDSKQAAEDTKSLLMLLSVHMYRQTFVQIPLHLSSALRATDEAHVVRLQPSGPDRGAGTLRIACPPRRHDGVLVSSERVLQARGEGVLAHFRGYPDGNGHWVFTGVPAGRLRVAMRTEDRWSWTDEVEVVLAPGQEAFAELEGRQPTGVFLRATDSQGRSILQFDHVHVESGDPPKSEPLQLPADVVRADESGLIQESVIGLRPGDYRLRVLAPGCKWTYTQPFKVTSGEVTIVNVALDSGP